MRNDNSITISQPAIIIVSGFSGAGKTSLIRAIPSEMNIELVRSYTTRIPRDENDRKNYFFVSREHFEQMRSKDAFVESVEYSGNLYGTPKSEIDRIVEAGKRPLLEIDVAGVRRICSEGLLSEYAIQSVFIAAEAEDLFKRLQARGTETPESIRARIAAAQEESRYINELYQTVIINGEEQTARSEFIEALKGKEANSRFDADRFREELTLLKQENLFHRRDDL